MFGPLRIFSVSEGFSRPIETGPYPEGFGTWSETLCKACHLEIAQEWETSMHAKAWHDPAFQGYWKHDDRPQVCLNCHTPLRNQQPDLVTGFHDTRKLDPILAPNPDYDEGLRNEGVTCAVCHVQDGVIVGPYADSIAPHPVRQDKSFLDGGGVCRRCHEVEGKDPGMFYIGPPCGTYAEVQDDPVQGFGCIQCHMPEVERPVAFGGPARKSGRHLWRGGHDPEMVRTAVKIDLDDRSRSGDRGGDLDVELRLSNVGAGVHGSSVRGATRKGHDGLSALRGAGHTFPTGDPDRFVTVTFVLRNTADGRIVRKEAHTLKRRILWRPVILEFGDDRLHAREERSYRFTGRVPRNFDAYRLDVEVAYHLMTERARKKIGYPEDLAIRHVLYSAQLTPGAGAPILDLQSVDADRGEGP